MSDPSALPSLTSFSFPALERCSYTTCHLSDSFEFAQEQSQGAASRKQQRSRSGGNKYDPSSSGVC